MTTTFNTWTHPKTGAVRVYISGFGPTKVWAEQQPVDQWGCTLKIVAQDYNRGRGELGNICNAAERAITAAAGKRLNLFSEVLALASK